MAVTAIMQGYAVNQVYNEFTGYEIPSCIANCTDETLSLRVVGGSTDREGRVEVCVGGRWGTVQTNQSLEVAETVCKSQSQNKILNFYNTSPSYG